MTTDTATTTAAARADSLASGSPDKCHAQDKARLPDRVLSEMQKHGTQREGTQVGRVEAPLRQIGGAFVDALPKFTTQSPGRLDVFGGICEYSGGLMLSSPLQESVSVVVQSRADQRIVVCPHVEGAMDGGVMAGGVMAGGAIDGADGFRLDISLGSFSPVRHDQPSRRPARSALAEVERFIKCGARGEARDDVRGDEVACGLARCVLASLLALLESRLLSDLNGGVTVAVESPLPLGTNVGAEEAVCISMIRAMGALHDRRWSEAEILQCAHLAARFSHGLDCLGTGAVLGCWFGDEALLSQYRCQPQVVLTPVGLPRSVTLMGIDCGVRDADAWSTYEEARVAAKMGRRVIEKILAYTGELDGWSGDLSQITVSDYVARYRHRLPTKIAGADFLERVGAHGDELTAIDPGVCYKIRSRTEHHIYENDRAHQFSRRLSRACRNEDRKPLIKAGELMYGSHWSYSQRCGLGSVATDRMVRLLRLQGAKKGVYGAKITGAGAGGTVVVLMEDSDIAHRAVRDAAAFYEEETGHTARLLSCGGAGAKGRFVRRWPSAGAPGDE